MTTNNNQIKKNKGQVVLNQFEVHVHISVGNPNGTPKAGSSTIGQKLASMFRALIAAIPFLK